MRRQKIITCLYFIFNRNEGRIKFGVKIRYFSQIGTRFYKKVAEKY
jgi:hypothetical protein